MNFFLPSLLESLPDPRLQTACLSADVLRLDKIHPVISGNKWFKLKYHLSSAKAGSHASILTFGGAWSNHIIAAAFAAAQYDLSSIGIIRGERPPQLSATLEAAAGYGMQLEFISRQQYAAKNDASFLQQLYNRFPDTYIVPEGGSGPIGIRGTAEILRDFPSSDYTHILCAIGTGATFLGLATASSAHQQLIGIPVLKGLDTLEALFASALPFDVPDHSNPLPVDNTELSIPLPPEAIRNNPADNPPSSYNRPASDPRSIRPFPSSLLSSEAQSRCMLLPDYHFGGYARHPDKLLTFMNDLYRQTGIPTDIVYTSKLFFAFYDLVQQHYFPAHSRILLIHSGGLQGNQSLVPGTLIF